MRALALRKMHLHGLVGSSSILALSNFTITRSSSTALKTNAATGLGDELSKGLSGDTYLHCSAMQPGIPSSLAKVLIEKGAAVDETNRKGLTALHCSALCGSMEIAEVLVEGGADVNHPSVDEKCWTPLCLAVRNGHADIVKLLVNNGADVNNKMAEGMTALHMVALEGDSKSNSLNMAKLLLENGSAVDMTSGSGFTPLIVAASRGHVEMVRLLINAGADVNCTVGGKKGGYSALSAAAIRGHLETMQLLMDNGASVSRTCFT